MFWKDLFAPITIKLTVTHILNSGGIALRHLSIMVGVFFMLYAAKGFRDFSNEVFGNCGYPNTLLANSVQNQNSLAVLFPKINKFSNLENWFAIILFPHDTLQFNIFSITFSSRFDESRGDFLFYIFFSKNTPQFCSAISNK